LCLRANSGAGVSRHYFDIGVFGYGTRPIAGGEGVESVFGGALAGRALVPLPDIRNNPLAIREYVSLDHGPPVRAPIWVEPAHGHGRPMCQAIAVAGQHAFEWVQAHPASFPPTIINITNGVATDSPYESASLDLWAQRLLTNIVTQDGAALLFNVFLSAGPGSAIFPATDGMLPAPGPELFRISSLLPPPMFANAEAVGDAPLPGARGLLLNVDCTMLVRFLSIGTRVGMRE
jgi:hypothetical protein